MTRGPVQLGALVERAVGSLFSPDQRPPRGGKQSPGGRSLDVFRAFERIGPPFTDHAEPSSFRQGRLVLKVRSSAWLTELGMMQRQIAARMNAGLPGPWVTEVRLVLGNPRPRPEPSRRPAPPQPTMAQKDRISEWAAQLPGGPLRAAFERAASASLACDRPRWIPYVGPPGPRVTLDEPEPPAAAFDRYAVPGRGRPT